MIGALGVVGAEHPGQTHHGPFGIRTLVLISYRLGRCVSVTRFPGAEIVDVRPPGGASPADADDLPEAPANESDPDA